MLVTPFGMFTLVRALHQPKARSPILVTLSGIVIAFSDLQPLNAALEMAIRLCGRDILVTAPEDANALSIITRVSSRTV